MKESDAYYAAAHRVYGVYFDISSIKSGFAEERAVGYDYLPVPIKAARDDLNGSHIIKAGFYCLGLVIIAGAFPVHKFKILGVCRRREGNEILLCCELFQVVLIRSRAFWYFKAPQTGFLIVFQQGSFLFAEQPYSGARGGGGLEVLLHPSLCSVHGVKCPVKHLRQNDIVIIILPFYLPMAAE